MNSEDFETGYYRYCRDLYGRLVPVDVARQNGRLVPMFHKNCAEPTEPGDPYEAPEYQETTAETTYGLSERQREVFLTYADCGSMAETGRRLGITHVGVRDFLRRMARKNDYVAYMLKRRKQAL